MERWKVFRAVDIGREFVSYGYKIEFIFNVAIFISFWRMDARSEYTSSSYAMLMMCYLQYYTLYNLIFNLIKKVKKYDKQEKVAAIVDFLPMTRKERNVSNFLINYRKSTTILIPYLYIFFIETENVYLRGLIVLNFVVIIWTESIRNVLMKNGAAEKKRKAILICDVIPVIFVAVSWALGDVYKPNIINIVGNLYIGIALGILSFAFMFYTAIRYKEVR